MTGFGSATVEFQQKTISVEIKSVNSKFFDLTLRLPPSYREKEMDLRTELARLIERGKAEVTFTIESQEVNKKTSINKSLVKAYYEEFKKVDTELNIYPNPAKQIFTVELLENNFDLKIFDVTGKKIFEKKNINTEVEMDSKDFENGIYFIQALTENQTIHRCKLIIAK